jgi:hypothetical protein
VAQWVVLVRLSSPLCNDLTGTQWPERAADNSSVLLLPPLGLVLRAADDERNVNELIHLML